MLIMQTMTLLLVSLGVIQLAIADNFAAVAGTGWIDISKLESTCSTPGYFVNPQDCSKFYCCVDHSTPDHSLLLRYDFECPGGLAFDESTSNCNYPGPNGCVGGGSGWGWNKPDPGSGWNKPDPGSGWNKPDPGSGWNKPDPGSGWNKPDPGSGWNKPDPGSGWNKPDPGSGWNKPDPGSGWNKPDPGSGWNKPDPGSGWNKPAPGSGWNKPAPGWNKPAPGSGWGWNKPGNWQNTNTVVNLPNSWGTPTRSPVGSSIIRLPTIGPTGGPSSGPRPSNPVVNLPSTTILQIPAGEWESLRLHPKICGETAACRTTNIVNPGVFQSSTVTNHNPSVTWGSSKILPIAGSGVVEGARVTPVPPAQWDSPPAYPVVPQNFQQVRVVEKPAQAWSSVKITPTPTPGPVNPHTRLVYVTQAPQAEAWHSQRISPSPVPYAPSVSVQSSSGDASVGLQNTRFAQVVQTPSVGWQQTPAVEWQNARITPVQQSTCVACNGPTAANPSLNFGQNGPTATPAVRVVQGNPGQPANPLLNVVHNAPSNLPLNGGWITQLPSGYIWQSTPNAKPQSLPFAASSPAPTGLGPSFSQISSRGNFGVVQQIINEEGGQSAVDGKSHIQLVYESKEKQQVSQQQASAAAVAVSQNQTPQELGPIDPSNPIYEFVAPPNSGIKGRIIVLYAPLNGKGEKREAPIIEVEVAQEEDEEDEDDSKNSQ